MLDALIDLVLPQPCAGCGAPTAWCRSCRDELAAAALRPLGLTRPEPAPPGFPRASAAAAYDGAVRGALIAHKERGRLGLVVPLGRALAAAVACLDPPAGVLLLPVPSSRAVVRARGHDHARRLARSAARALTEAGRPARAAGLLAPARLVGDQAGLDSRARAANLAGAFRVTGEEVGGKHVVVVDDVVTSGASIAEATRALTAAGARVHGAATVAATLRRSSQWLAPTPVQ